MNRLLPLLLASAALALTACNRVQAPGDPGVCWHMVQLKDGKVRFNQLASNVPNLESCAAALEAMRLRFAALGSTTSQMVGAYQGHFLFLQPEGIFTGQSLDGPHYPFLVRTGDGRLVKPGVLPAQ